MTRELLHAILLPLPPWFGFLIFRMKGRVGLSYGYFLGGVLAVLAAPWPAAGNVQLPSAYMGGSLFGFTLFLQAHREGAQGLRRLSMGVGGATIFAAVVGAQLGVSLQSFAIFWAGAVVEGLLWLGLSDLGYRIAGGKYLQLRMPLVGGSAMLLGSLLHHALPLNSPAMAWWSSLLAGLMLGLVALQQLLWMRGQGTWVEGRGDSVRIALSALEQQSQPESQSLAWGIEAQQAILLVNEKGAVLESNGAFSRLVGMPRHRIRGYELASLFQGQDRSVWEELRQELAREGAGSTQATLVQKDGTFQDVTLEAAAFDRNMALLWVLSPESGSLSLRTGGGAFLHDRPEGGSYKELVNALGAIQPATEQILQETKEPRTRHAAELILLAASRLKPDAGHAPLDALLPASEALQALGPKLQRMMPAGIRVDLKSAPLTLQLSAEALERIAGHLVLHGRQALKSGTVILSLEPRILGGRPWALLSLELDGQPAVAVQDLVGLAWLQDQVGRCRGMLELCQEPGGSLWPQIYLPTQDRSPRPQATPLLARTVWVVDQDPLVREALSQLIRRGGGEVQAFEDLKQLFRASRDVRPPDLLVLELTPRLERFQKAIRAFQREPIPTLVVGDGHGMPLPPLGLGLNRIGFIQKPFDGQDFIQSLLGLLQALRRTPA